MKLFYLLLISFFFICATNAIASVGDLSQFGDNVWNVYAWNAGDANGGSGARSMNYAGYYVDNSLSSDTSNKWDSTFT